MTAKRKKERKLARTLKITVDPRYSGVGKKITVDPRCKGPLTKVPVKNGPITVISPAYRALPERLARRVRRAERARRGTGDSRSRSRGAGSDPEAPDAE